MASTKVRSVSWRLSVEGDQIAVQKLEAVGAAGAKAIQPMPGYLKGLSAASRTVQSDLEGLAGRAGGVGAALAAMGPVGLGVAATLVTVGIAATAALSASERAMQFADGIEKSAKQLKLGTTAFQEITEAGKEFNLTSEDVTSGLSTLQGNVAQFIAGLSGRNGKRVFDELGLSRQDLANAGDFEQQLNLIADRLSKIQNPNVRAGIADKLGIRDLLPMLQNGKTGLDRLRDGAEKAGLVLEGALVKSLADASREYGALEQKISIKSAEAVVGIAHWAIKIKEAWADVLTVLSNVLQRMLDIKDRTSDSLKDEVGRQWKVVGNLSQEIKGAEDHNQLFVGRVPVTELKRQLAVAQQKLWALNAELQGRDTDVSDAKKFVIDNLNGPPKDKPGDHLPPSLEEEQAAEKARALAERRTQFIDQVLVAARRAAGDRVNSENAADVEILKGKAGYYQALLRQADAARDADIDTINAQRDAQLDALDKLGKGFKGYEETRQRILQTAQDQTSAVSERNRAERYQIAQEAAGSLAQLRQQIMGPLQTSLQDIGSSGLERFTDDLAAVATGAKDAGEAISDMVTSILADVAKLVLQRSVEAPLAGFLNTAISSVFAGGHASGGGTRGGAVYRVNEKGGMPETYFTSQGDGYVLSSPSSLNNMVELVSRRLQSPAIVMPGSAPKVEVHNHGEPLAVDRQTYDQGSNTMRVDLKKQLTTSTASDLRGGSHDAAMKDRFGLTPIPRRRT